MQIKKRTLFPLLFTCILQFVCSNTSDVLSDKTIRIVISPKADPRIVYGTEQLRDVLASYGDSVEIVTGKAESLEPYTITVGAAENGTLFANALKGDAAKPQGFALIAKKNVSMLIAGADPAGALYGCLELVDRLEMSHGRFPNKRALYDYPRMKLRGPCFPLAKVHYDGLWRPEDFPWLYDREWWIHYLDQLVRNRYNTMTIWNGHPFNSILKLQKYPEARQLDDAQIEANVDLMSWLCNEAGKRNIWIILNHYNIHLPGSLAKAHHLEQNTLDVPTPWAEEYMRYCYSEYIRNYPNVGMMLCLGEALLDSLAPGYMRDVVIPGVKAGLRPGQPEPPIIVRAHQVPIFKVMDKAESAYSNLYVMAKYNNECLASDQVGGGTGADAHRHYEWEADGMAHVNLAKKFPVITNIHLVRNLEPFRWSSPDFIQRAVRSCVDIGIAGLHVYPLAYWEWPYSMDKTEPQLQQVDRDVMWYRAWGRYSWNPYRERKKEKEYWSKWLAGRFGSEKAGRYILEAYEKGGEVLPHIQRAFVHSSGGRPLNLRGYTLEQLWMSSRWYATEKGEIIADFVRREVEGLPHEGELPLQAADDLLEDAEEAVKAAEKAKAFVTKNNEEFNRFLNDMKATRFMARFIRHKVEAAIAGLLYKSTGDLDQFFRCANNLEESVEAFRGFDAILKKNYNSERGLATMEAELSVIRHNAEVLRQQPELTNQLAQNARPFPPIRLEAKSPDQSLFKIEQDARPYTDTAIVLGPGLPEQFIGLNSIMFSHHQSVTGSTKIAFQSDEPVKAFVAVMDSKRERVRPSSWLNYLLEHKEIRWPYCNLARPEVFAKYRKDPWASIPSDWNLYLKGNKITGPICDIFWKDFPAGKSVIDVGSGRYVLLGFTRTNVDLAPWTGMARTGSMQLLVQRIDLH